MASNFISKVDRPAIHLNDNAHLGPGAYDNNQDFSSTLPGYTPFNSSSKRSPIIDQQKLLVPAPGHYNVKDDILKKSVTGGASLMAKSKRFDTIDDEFSTQPGPGSYVIKSVFEKSKPKKINKSSNILEDLNIPTVSKIPSIPTRFQSYGYEIGRDGSLILQDALHAGYSGLKKDTVGPGDYEPKLEIKYKAMPISSFGKAPERKIDLVPSNTGCMGPGPGEYNMLSEFDQLGKGTRSHGDKDCDLLLRLKATRTRQSAIFQSSTERNSFMQEVLRRDAPGPGQYDVPAAILPATLPVEQQRFSSSCPRFKETVPRSMVLHTAPGAYNPITSDFDNQKLKILRQKKMTNRSRWVKGISFEATEPRFFTLERPITTNTDYHLNDGIADKAPRPNLRAGPFGSKATRFKDPKVEVSSIEEEPPKERKPQIIRPKPQFYENRNVGREFRPLEKDAPFPSPGAYDIAQEWTAAKPVIMCPPSGHNKSIKPADKPVPGPGAYNPIKGIGEQRHTNRKNIMISTTERGEEFDKPVPGPGTYNAKPLLGTLLKPSFNAMLTV